MKGPWKPDPESLLGVPSAAGSEAPAAICLVAEDVVAGLEIVVRALQETASQDPPGPRMIGYERRLKGAGEYLINYFEDLYRVDCVPYMELVGHEEIVVDRLGILPDGDYALYDSQARLPPSVRRLINYGGYHTVPIYNSERDTLPGSHSSQQLYVGHAPRTLEDMHGYAISWNHLRNLFGSGQAVIGAAPKSELNQLGLTGTAAEELGGFVRR